MFQRAMLVGVLLSLTIALLLTLGGREPSQRPAALQATTLATRPRLQDVATVALATATLPLPTSTLPPIPPQRWSHLARPAPRPLIC